MLPVPQSRVDIDCDALLVQEEGSGARIPWSSEQLSKLIQNFIINGIEVVKLINRAL